MNTTKQDPDGAAREAFLSQVAALWPLAKGSLTETRTPCVRANCKACASGRKHGTLIFTYREGGRLKGMYVRKAQAGEVRRAVENGRRLEALLAGLGRELILRGREA
jgi:hypothetical protein